VEIYPISNYIYIYTYTDYFSDKREGDKGHMMLRDISPWTQVFISGGCSMLMLGELCKITQIGQFISFFFILFSLRIIWLLV